MSRNSLLETGAKSEVRLRTKWLQVQVQLQSLNKFTLLLRKGVYPYKYMDSWEKFNETSLTNKEYFYIELNKEYITNEDYAHAQKVWNTFNTKNLGEYHDLYV